MLIGFLIGILGMLINPYPKNETGKHWTFFLVFIVVLNAIVIGIEELLGVRAP